MNIKFVLPALLALCGAAYVSPVHAAVYRCMVYSGADGQTRQESTNNDAKYEVKANSLEEAQAAAIKKVSGIKKATMTRAQCDLDSSKSGTASAPATSTTAPAPAAAPAPAPAPPATGGGKTMYCMIYDDSNEFVMPPKEHEAENMIWKVPVSSIQTADDDAKKFVQALGKNVDSAMCEGSVAAFKSESY
jgi:hypothetical protein